MRDDRETLQSCTLTCKSWLPRSSRHLLCYVAISNKDIHYFVQDISSSTPSRLACYVVKLTVSLSQPFDGSTVAHPSVLAPFPLLHTLILSLPHLNDLRIHISHKFRLHIPALTNTGKELNVLRVNGIPPAALQEFLGWFKTAALLVIDDAVPGQSRSEMGQDLSLDTTSKHSVRSLQLRANRDMTMLKRLHNMLDLSRLEHLKVAPQKWPMRPQQEAMAVNAIFRILGEKIRHFTYIYHRYVRLDGGECPSASVVKHPSETHDIDIPALRLCKSLRSARIYTPQPSIPLKLMNWGTIRVILASLPPQVTEITLIPTILGISDRDWDSKVSSATVPGMDWMGFEKAMQHITALQRLNVHFEGVSTIGCLRSAVLAEFTPEFKHSVKIAVRSSPSYE